MKPTSAPDVTEQPNGVARGSLRRMVRRPRGVTLIPVPIGAKIAGWHWWLSDILSMTEGERIIYYGHSRIGSKVTPREYGTLFYVRIPNDHIKSRPPNAAHKPSGENP